MRAVIVFDDRAELKWFDYVFRTRPGFRHCWVAVETAGGWVELDTRGDWFAVETIAGRGFDLAAHYRKHGCTVFETTAVEPEKVRFPWFPVTCVEIVKRIVGVRRWWCWTPYQLWRLLHEEPQAAEDRAAAADAGPGRRADQQREEEGDGGDASPLGPCQHGPVGVGHDRRQQPEARRVA